MGKCFSSWTNSFRLCIFILFIRFWWNSNKELCWSLEVHIKFAVCVQRVSRVMRSRIVHLCCAMMAKCQNGNMYEKDEMPFDTIKDIWRISNIIEGKFDKILEIPLIPSYMYILFVNAMASPWKGDLQQLNIVQWLSEMSIIYIYL